MNNKISRQINWIKAAPCHAATRPFVRKMGNEVLARVQPKHIRKRGVNFKSLEAQLPLKKVREFCLGL